MRCSSSARRQTPGGSIWSKLTRLVVIPVPDRVAADVALLLLLALAAVEHLLEELELRRGAEHERRGRGGGEEGDVHRSPIVSPGEGGVRDISKGTRLSCACSRC